MIQRFWSGLQLNVHYHSLLVDGVFAEAADGSLRFHPAPPPTDAEVARLFATIIPPFQGDVFFHPLHQLFYARAA